MEVSKNSIFYTLVVSFVVGGIAGGMTGASIAQKAAKSVRVSTGTQEAQQEQDIRLPIDQSLLASHDAPVIQAIETTSPAVVSIIVTKDLSKVLRDRYSPFPFDDFFFGFPFGNGMQQPPSGGKQEVGGGTGFIISADGLVVTNRHVVDDSDAEYMVLLNTTEEKYSAQVLARDPILDLAVLKIEATNLPTVRLGDSDTIKIGQSVIAIGNALGEFRNTVTTGVVSGIGRTIHAGGSMGSETIERAIQTDAAINPGNSGGPLLTISGEVIGINTAISSEGQLIGFAIPINEAKRVIESVKEHGRIVRPFLGVRYILLNSEVAKENQIAVDHGALVVRGEQRTDLAVVPGSPADKAGIVENDIILEIGGIKVDENNSLVSLLSRFAPGDSVSLKVYHRGEEKEVNVLLEEFKDSKE